LFTLIFKSVCSFEVLRLYVNFAFTLFLPLAWYIDIFTPKVFNILFNFLDNNVSVLKYTLNRLFFNFSSKLFIFIPSNETFGIFVDKVWLLLLYFVDMFFNIIFIFL